jgi:hypothetical protein
VSVGIEDADDLVADIKAALARALHATEAAGAARVANARR